MFKTDKTIKWLHLKRKLNRRIHTFQKKPRNFLKQNYLIKYPPNAQRILIFNKMKSNTNNHRNPVCRTRNVLPNPSRFVFLLHSCSLPITFLMKGIIYITSDVFGTESNKNWITLACQSATAFLHLPLKFATHWYSCAVFANWFLSLLAHQGQRSSHCVRVIPPPKLEQKGSE